MFIREKDHLASVKRVRVAEGRNLDEGLRLDRNERVDVWPAEFLADVFAQVPPYFLSVYPESGALYSKLARFHGVNEDELLLTSGIDGGLKTVFEAATSPGDTVGIVTPTYAMYAVYARIFDVEAHALGYSQSFELESIDGLLARKPSVFFLPNPNQPIESVFGVEELAEIARRTLEANCLFVIDEAYHMFGAESAVELIRRYENVVIARTLSKGFGVPSIRLGYLISNAGNIEALAKTRFAHESNSLTNAVAEYLLDHLDVVEDYNGRVVESREQLKDVLGERGIPARGLAANFLLLDLGSTERAAAFVEELRAKTIYVKGPWAEPWGRYVTITLGPIETMDRFVNAVESFVAAGVR
ncbi:MAG TPA: histidinol-phosphate transaminase [Gaiellaceae bacterium]|nr:histidinol-phosphate transaminase [Gaiellaceae bacterium]